MKFSLKRLLIAFLLVSGTVQQSSAGWIPSWVPSVSFQSVKTFLDKNQTTLLGVTSLAVIGTGLGYAYYKNFWQSTPIQKPAQNASVTSYAFPLETIKEVGELSLITNMLPNDPLDKNKQEDLEDIFKNFSSIPLDKKMQEDMRERNPSPVPQDKKEQGTPEDQLPFEWATKTFHEWHAICKNLNDYTVPEKELLNKGQKGRRLIERQNKQLALTLAEFHKALDHYFITLNNNEFFRNAYCWVNQDIPQQLFESIQSEENKPVFEPFVQKLVVNPGCTIAFHGDIHGDVKSLNAFIEDLANKEYLHKHDPFKIKNPNFYLIFLGDYTDRGWYGAEVIYTIVRLKCANPDRVFMVRGNHDDRSFNTKEQATGINSFFGQLSYKYGMQQDDLLLEKIGKLYETLPLALYFGSPGIEETNYIVCCHGGVEIGFNPHALLHHESPLAFTKLGALDRGKGLATIINTPSLFELFNKANFLMSTPEDLGERFAKNFEGYYVPWYTPTGIITKIGQGRDALLSLIGFQWNDYEVNPQNEINWFVQKAHGRGLVIGKIFNQAVLALYSDEHHKVRGVFRAHQHSMGLPLNPMMKRIFNQDGLDHKRNRGVGKLWISNAREKSVNAVWDNIVCTFNVSPHTPYQTLGYTYDTFGLLTTANVFDEWHLQVCRIEMFKPSKPVIPSVEKPEIQRSTEIKKPAVEVEVKNKADDELDSLMDDFVTLCEPDETFTIDDQEFMMM